MMKAKLTLEDGTEFNVTVDESELKKETSKRWKPSKDQMYWVVSGTGEVHDHLWSDFNIYDKWQYSQRNAFKTKEEAEQHLAILKARAAILDHADEVNEGWVPDWSDDDEIKYNVYYDHNGKSLGFMVYNFMQEAVIVSYRSSEAAEDAINKVGDAYLTVLGVEK